METAHLTENQLLRLLKAARKQKHRSAERNWLMILVAYWHGLRAGEVVRLKGTDIRDGKIILRRGKGSETNLHSLVRHPNLLLNEAPALIKLAREVGDRPLFPYTRQHAYHLVHVIAESLDFPETHRKFHMLKHSIATHSVARGVQIQYLQKRLGWKSLSSVGVYLRPTDDQAEDAVMAAFRKGKP